MSLWTGTGKLKFIGIVDCLAAIAVSIFLSSTTQNRLSREHTDLTILELRVGFLDKDRIGSNWPPTKKS
jgi:hypothetical protein